MPNLTPNHSRFVAAFGLSPRAFCAFVAAVTAYEFGKVAVCRRDVSELVERVDGFRCAGDDLLALFRLGYLKNVGRIGNDIFYTPLSHAVARAREWAGWERTRGAAE